ncbi:unnamed protein product [Musa textilis]
MFELFDPSSFWILQGTSRDLWKSPSLLTSNEHFHFLPKNGASVPVAEQLPPANTANGHDSILLMRGILV